MPGGLPISLMLVRLCLEISESPASRDFFNQGSCQRQGSILVCGFSVPYYAGAVEGTATVTAVREEADLKLSWLPYLVLSKG